MEYRIDRRGGSPGLAWNLEGKEWMVEVGFPTSTIQFPVMGGL